MARVEAMPTWSPRTLEQALDLLGDRPDLTVLAGGTDLMVQLQSRTLVPSGVLNIWGVDALRGILLDGEDLVIGATTPYSVIIRSGLVGEHAPTLVAAAKTVGAGQIQNRGTLGGNIANASPAADTPPVLLAAAASVDLRSRWGRRQVPLDEFFKGYKQLNLQPGELITAIRVPRRRATDRDWFQKVGTRQAQSISKVVVAGRARMADDGTIALARVAAGSVAPTTIHLQRLEAALHGERPSLDLAARAREAAMEDVTPISDVRSTEDYRRTVTGNLAARFVRALMAPPA